MWIGKIVSKHNAYNIVFFFNFDYLTLPTHPMKTHGTALAKKNKKRKKMSMGFYVILLIITKVASPILIFKA